MINSFQLSGSAVLHSLPDEQKRFKTAQLTAALILPLEQHTASEYAILPFLLRRSCADYPDFTALQRRLEQLYGADIFADVSGLGDYQALLLGTACLNDDYALEGEHITSQCAELLCSMLFSPVLPGGTFPAEDVEQEKRCLIELIESQINEKRYYARQRCTALLCEGEGYALDCYGTAEGVAALTPQSITAAWRRALENARIVFIHHGDPEQGRRLADSLTVRLTGQDRRKAADMLNVINDIEKVKEQTERMDINQAKLVMGLKYTGDRQQLSSEISALRLMNSLLGGSPLSLLFRNVREALSLCYYCSSSFDRLKGTMLIDCGVDESNAEKAREQCLYQLTRIADGDFTDQDLESARLSLTSQFLSLSDRQGSLGMWYVGQSLDGAMQSPEHAAADLSTVTREQVIAAAQKIKLGCVYMLAGKESGNA